MAAIDVGEAGVIRDPSACVRVRPGLRVLLWLDGDGNGGGPAGETGTLEAARWLMPSLAPELIADVLGLEAPGEEGTAQGNAA